MKVYVVGKKEVISYIAMAFLLILCGASFAHLYLEDPGTKSAAASVRQLPIYSVETQEKKVAISFDAAAGAEDTDQLIEILGKHNVKGTFFLCGCWIRNHPEAVKKLYEAGHEIANHGNTHADMIKMDEAGMEKEIMDTHEEIKKLLGIEMTLFRPPYGSYNDQVIQTTRRLGYEAVQWDVDSLDWKEQGLEPMIRQVLDNKNLRNGSIMLFHNDAKYTAAGLDQILTGLEEKGFTVVPVSELLLEGEYTIDHTGRQYPATSTK